MRPDEAAAKLLGELEDLEAGIARIRYLIKQLKPPRPFSNAYHEESVKLFNEHAEAVGVFMDGKVFYRGSVANPKSTWWRIVMSRWNGET